MNLRKERTAARSHADSGGFAVWINAMSVIQSN
jgi:hypothetical protein